MADPPSTRPSLLVRIRDPRDAQSWGQFVEIYAPLVYGFARKRGLQDADAADLTQDVLRAVSATASRLDYDPRRGSFRGWLFTVARNKLHNFLTSRERQTRARGGAAAQQRLEEQPARPDNEADLWDQEYEQRLFDWAAEKVRGGFQDATWQAFWQVAVDGRRPREVADALGMSVGAVYIAKSRVLTRLKEQIRQMLGE